MTVRDYLRVLRERWVIITLATILGIALGAVFFLLRPPTYTAQVSLYVSAQVGDNPQQAYQCAQLSEQRVKSYNELVTGNRVMSETIRRLGLEQTPEQLASHVTATSALDSVIINISVSDRSAETAALTANTVGSVTTQVVDELERPAAPNGIAPVAVRLVEAAPVPTKPSSTGLPLTLAIGFLGGLVVGLSGALVRNALDNSVKSAEALADVACAPVVGVIAFDAQVPKKPLTIHGDPQSARSEAFRQLRTNLQFIDVDNPRKVILISSSLPGEGKSTTAANLAIAVAAAGMRVLVIEADLRRPRLSELLGVDRKVGLTTVLSGRLKIEQAVQQFGGGSFDILASGPTPPNPSELLASNAMRSLLEDVKAAYDMVLVDAPPLLPVTDAAAIAPATDGAVLVCRFKKTTRQQVVGAVSALRSVTVEPLGAVLNMVPDSGPLAYARYNTYYSSEVAASPEIKAAPIVRREVERTQEIPQKQGSSSQTGIRPRSAPPRK